MKKILSLAFLAAFVVALGASVGCEEKKTTSGPSNKTPSSNTTTPAAKTT